MGSIPPEDRVRIRLNHVDLPRAVHLRKNNPRNPIGLHRFSEKRLGPTKWWTPQYSSLTNPQSPRVAATTTFTPPAPSPMPHSHPPPLLHPLMTHHMPTTTTASSNALNPPAKRSGYPSLKTGGNNNKNPPKSNPSGCPQTRNIMVESVGMMIYMHTRYISLLEMLWVVLCCVVLCVHTSALYVALIFDFFSTFFQLKNISQI